MEKCWNRKMENGKYQKSFNALNRWMTTESFPACGHLSNQISFCFKLRCKWALGAAAKWKRQLSSESGRETTSLGSLLAVVAALWQSLAKALPCVKLFVFWLFCLALCLSTSCICLLATLRMAASCVGNALAPPSDTPKHLLIPWQSAKCNSFSCRRSNGSAASALNELHKIHEAA